MNYLGVFDVSNKRRLGHSEVQLALDMYKGVNELIEVEKSLDTKIVPFPQFPQDCHSLLNKHLTPEVFDQIKFTKDEFGFTFK